MHPFLYGAILALGLIIPLGMQNVFIFNQGVTQRKWMHAMPGVITAFLCDALLIMSAVLGISVAVISIPSVKSIIYDLGFLFLMYMGWITWRSSGQVTGDFEPLSARQQIYFSASVSLLNPHAILDSVAVIGTNSLNFSGHDKWIYMVACMLVSLAWFLVLSFIGRIVSNLGSSPIILKWLNKFSALTIWAVALYLAKQILAFHMI